MSNQMQQQVRQDLCSSRNIKIYLFVGTLALLSSFYASYTYLPSEYKHHDLPDCTSTESLYGGHWKNKLTIGNAWIGTDCKLSDKIIWKSTSNKTVGLYGDSLLKKIYHHLVQNANLESDCESFSYEAGGKCTGSEVAFHWTASAYHQQPYSYGSKYFDVVVISMGVWDMGTYYRGASRYYSKMHNNLQKIIQFSRPGARILLSNLHKLWPERCEDKNSPCVTCNTPGKEIVFRAMIKRLACDFKEVELFDMFPFTNTSLAKASGGDAVHYSDFITGFEAAVLAKLIGGEFRERGTSCEPNVEFDVMLSQYEEVNESCIPKNWKPRQNKETKNAQKADQDAEL